MYNLSFTFWPEMLSRPFLILHGWLPYQDFVMEHSPLLLFVLAGWFKLFGLGFFQLQVFTWGIIGVTAAIIKKYYSLVAALTYLLLVFAYQGNGLWFDLALTPLLLVCFLLLEKKKYFSAGVVYVLAFFTKQTAIWFLPLFLYFIFRDISALKKFLLGLIFTAILAVLSLAGFGILDDFLRWATSVRASALWPTPAQLIYASAPFIVIFLPSIIDHQSSRKYRLLTMFSAFSIFPRWELLHLQPALPYLAILLAGFFSQPNKIITKTLLAVLLCGFLFRQYGQIFNQPDRFREPDFLQAVEYVKSHTGQSDRILVLNTWESLYALSGRLPVSRPLYPYLPWYMDLPGAQESVINNLESQPAKLIIEGVAQSAGLGSYQPQKLMDYIGQNYHQTDKIGSLMLWVAKSP